ncbi:formate--phosphoribosylaminoimidazolecarboxamide ligase [Nanoarchaeota archaeon]
MGEYKIATIGSHSALQILKGAKDEGFETIAICTRGREKLYKMFGVADEIILLDSYSDFFKIEQELIEKKAIIIPHGSFVAYLGLDKIEQLKVPYFGNKGILKWESDRDMERRWLLASGLKLPKIFKTPSEIDRPVIVKFHGAQGGAGYFIANSPEDFRRKIQNYPPELGYVIQEYVIGVPVYAHYFYSSLTKKLELMGFDLRYESNVDSLGRISARDQMAINKVDPSYVVVGNTPVVIRESLLPRFIEMGEAVVRESEKVVEGGLFGPFCLENIITPELDIFTFEISARIVAGTNPYTNGSPYSWLYYDEPMSTGRRIAREIKNAERSGVLKRLVQ